MNILRIPLEEWLIIPPILRDSCVNFPKNIFFCLGCLKCYMNVGLVEIRHSKNYVSPIYRVRIFLECQKLKHTYFQILIT